MAFSITESCIGRAACESECPVSCIAIVAPRSATTREAAK